VKLLGFNCRFNGCTCPFPCHTSMTYICGMSSCQQNKLYSIFMMSTNPALMCMSSCQQNKLYSIFMMSTNPALMCLSLQAQFLDSSYLQLSWRLWLYLFMCFVSSYSTHIIIGIVFYILSASILLTFVLPFYVELKSNLISSTAGEMQYSTCI
jgi:hypothetical protein